MQEEMVDGSVERLDNARSCFERWKDWLRIVVGIILSLMISRF